MLRVKLLAVFIIAGFAVWGCSKKKEFVIAESKSYEASIFRQNCAVCHGLEAEGRTLSDGTVIPNLRKGDFKYKTDDQIYQHIADGGNGVVPFRNRLSERDLGMMVDFVRGDLRRQ